MYGRGWEKWDWEHGDFSGGKLTLLVGSELEHCMLKMQLQIILLNDVL